MVSEQDKSPGPSEVAADDRTPESETVVEHGSAAAEASEGGEPAEGLSVEQLQEQLLRAQAELVDARDQANLDDLSGKITRQRIQLSNKHLIRDTLDEAY